DFHDVTFSSQREPPLAPLRAALHRGLEQLDETGGNYRVRHAVGNRLVRGSPGFMGAGKYPPLHRFQRLPGFWRADQWIVSDADQRKPKYAQRYFEGRIQRL